MVKKSGVLISFYLPTGTIDEPERTQGAQRINPEFIQPSFAASSWLKAPGSFCFCVILCFLWPTGLMVGFFRVVRVFRGQYERVVGIVRFASLRIDFAVNRLDGVVRQSEFQPPAV